jgi:hypothetical protein
MPCSTSPLYITTTSRSPATDPATSSNPVPGRSPIAASSTATVLQPTDELVRRLRRRDMPRVATSAFDRAQTTVPAPPLASATLGQKKSGSLEPAPGEMREIGAAQGWTFFSDETIRLTHRGYQDKSMVRPREVGRPRPPHGPVVLVSWYPSWSISRLHRRR